MIKSNFLFNVDSRVCWESGKVGDIQFFVEASNETEAKKIAEEELMNKEHWKVKEIMWQELAPSRHYLSRD